MLKLWSSLILGLLLGACGVPGTRLPSAALRAPAAEPPPGMPSYRVDPARSELRLLVYRAGAMAHLGHNHVIVNHSLAGWVAVADSVAAGAFALEVPVADFVVDERQARAAAGADFAAEVTEEAKAGTLRNLSSEALLNAGAYPVIALRSVQVSPVSGAASGLTVALNGTVWVSIAGHETTVTVPFELDRSTAGRLTARADFTLRQSQLGLTPFSVMMGALQVQDEFAVRIELTAVAD